MGAELGCLLGRLAGVGPARNRQHRRQSACVGEDDLGAGPPLVRREGVDLGDRAARAEDVDVAPNLVLDAGAEAVEVDHAVPKRGRSETPDPA